MSNTQSPTRASRPVFPKRAIITGGMPFGNKSLHFGHIGAVFIQADIFSRFLRDRIGKQNVIFQSGTDCYGSPIVEQYERMKAEGGFAGTIQAFVQSNPEKQKETLGRYQVALDLFAASSFGRCGEIHAAYSAAV